jgi:hypothetical protein
MEQFEFSITIDLDDVKETEEWVRNVFARETLEKMGLPLDEIWPAEEELTVEHKAELRVLLAQYDVDILDDGDRGLIIYVENDVVAELMKPRYRMHKDIKARRASQRLFYEMMVKYKTLFGAYDSFPSKEQQ